ncbi:MAG TPA: Calx-beta domain-containing protein [Steroidobacteraceae bacterium]|nr:Calx-beta domain-containing protein [Steroidobacteraceae bacterium]
MNNTNAGARMIARFLALTLCAVSVAALAATSTYTYDGLGRLVKVTTDDGKVTDYGLDAAGNRTGVTTVQTAGALQFTAATFTVGEAGPTASITVSRTGSTTGAVGVTCATVAGGSATAGSDYTTTSTVLSWANGTGGNQTCSIPITNDTAVESNETISLQLSAPTGGAMLGPQSTATLTITDNDVPPVGTLQFSAATYSVGEAGPSVTITVSRANGTNGAIGVSYATVTGGTATAGSDYTTKTGTLSWANGDSASKTFTVSILEDSAVEGSETVNLQLTSPTGGATLGTPNTAVLTITDNDVAPIGTLQFSAATYSVGEAGPTATITVTRANGSSGAVGVSYATVTGGTAAAGSDYTTKTGTLSWASGDAASKTFTVSILEDSAVEGSETVNLQLSSPTGGATLGSQTTAVLTITDNDNPPAGTLQFNGSSASVNESAGTVTIPVSRVGGSFGAVGVTCATANGTATAGSDYTAVSTVLSWANGDVADKSCTVPITNDSTYENAETFTASLSAATGGGTAGSGTYTVTINNSGAAPVFTIGNVSVNENAGTVTLTVTKTGSTALSHAVRVDTQDGNATAGSDYTAVSAQVLTFASATTTQTVTVNLLDDAIYEGSSEGFGVALSAATNGATIGTALANVTILENDAAPTFSIGNTSVTEGGTASITVTKGGNATTQSHSVSYISGGGTAIAGTDYVTVGGGQLTFLPGETSKTITVNATSDGVFEGSENYNITLSSPTGGATIAVASGSVTINDASSVSFSISAGLSQPENTTSMTFTITKSGNTNLSHTVSYATANGSASAGSDYTAVSSSHTFTPGETTSSFSVPLLTDSVFEGPETFTVTLSGATNGATIGTSSVTNTITDSNVVFFEITGATVNENAGTVTLTVTKTGATLLTHGIHYANNGGTATPGSDYSAFSGDLSFAPADTSKTFSFSLTDDTAVEGQETIVASLSGGTNGAFPGPNSSATVTINDNDVFNPITISDVYAPAWGETSAFAYYYLYPDGSIVATGNGALGTWITPATGMSNYQVRAINQDASCPAPSNFNTWQPLTQLRGWSMSASGENQNLFCAFTVQISAIANPSVILGTAHVTLNPWTGF